MRVRTSRESIWYLCPVPIRPSANTPGTLLQREPRRALNESQIRCPSLAERKGRVCKPCYEVVARHRSPPGYHEGWDKSHRFRSSRDLEGFQLGAPEPSKKEPGDQASDVCEETSAGEEVQTSDEYDQYDTSWSCCSPHDAIDRS